MCKVKLFDKIRKTYDKINKMIFENIFKMPKNILAEYKTYSMSDRCPKCHDELAMSLLGGYLFCLNDECDFRPKKFKVNAYAQALNTRYLATQEISETPLDDQTVKYIRKSMSDMRKQLKAL